jgi:hypothetical protein
MDDGSLHLVVVRSDGQLAWNSRNDTSPATPWNGWMLVPSGTQAFLPSGSVSGIVIPGGFDICAIDLQHRLQRFRFDLNARAWTGPFDTGGRLEIEAGMEMVAFGTNISILAVNKLGRLVATQFDQSNTSPSQWWELRSRLSAQAGVCARASGTELLIVAADEAGLVWTSRWREETDEDDWHALSG